MKIQNVKIEKVIPYENNPRNNDEAVKYVAESIKEFGWQQPIVVDKDFIIIAGHTRLKAAEELGLREVPVTIADKLTDEQVKAYRLADNKVGEIATWNDSALFDELNELVEMDFDMEPFGFEIEPDPETAGDDYEMPEITEPRTKEGDLYQLGQHRLLCGDSTDPENIKKLMSERGGPFTYRPTLQRQLRRRHKRSPDNCERRHGGYAVPRVLNRCI